MNSVCQRFSTSGSAAGSPGRSGPATAGARWHLPKHAQEVFSGDLIVPQGFRWAVESKGGYSKIDINSVFVSGNAELDAFLDQTTKDAERLRAKADAVLETGPKAVAGVRTDEGTGRAFLHLPPSLQSVVGCGIGRVVDIAGSMVLGGGTR